MKRNTQYTRYFEVHFHFFWGFDTGVAAAKDYRFNFPILIGISVTFSLK